MAKGRNFVRTASFSTDSPGQSRFHDHHQLQGKGSQVWMPPGPSIRCLAYAVCPSRKDDSSSTDNALDVPVRGGLNSAKVGRLCEYIPSLRHALRIIDIGRQEYLCVRRETRRKETFDICLPRGCNDRDNREESETRTGHVCLILIGQFHKALASV